MKKISAVSVAFTYVGTVVGAGFASGQELKKYFADFGVYGLFGLMLAAFLFFYLGKKIMILCKQNNIDTYNKLLNLLSNNILSKIFDFLITIFLIGSLTTMGAGMGSILKQVFDVPIWLGSFLLIILSVVVVKKGINKISKLNVFIVPILIFVTILIAISAFNREEFSLFVASSGVLKCTIFSVLYVAYNIVMAISILPALAMATDREEIEKGTKWAGVIIGGLGLLITLALLTNYDIIQNIEIPLAALSNKYIVFYIITFILEVFSTAVSSLYGVYKRINENKKMLYIIVAISYCFSLFGFSNLIIYLYGIMGGIGVFMITALLKRGEWK